MTLPPDSLSDRRTKVLLAVVDGERTVRGTARRVGLSPSAAYEHLQALRADGLIAWTDGEQGTIHPRVSEVPVHMYGSGYNQGTKRSAGAPVDAGPRRGHHLIGGDDDGGI